MATPKPQQDSFNSIIGAGSIFQGKFHVAGSLQIDGKFEGEISTEDTLYIGETGRVKTDKSIKAKSVVVAGVLIGNIEATEEVKLLETGRVLGNIITPHLEMKPGVVMKGEVIVTAGQKKEVEKIIEDAYNAGPTLPTEPKKKEGLVKEGVM